MRNVLIRSSFTYVLPDATGPTSELVVEAPAPSSPASTPTRHQRRKSAVFNRRLKRRLEKDNSQARVEVLPDGGIQVTVKKE